MAVNLSPIWGAGAQLLDNSGNVLSGGKIYTYAAGTTTQITTYTSNAGNVANSNPIVLNSAGRVPYEIWLTDGQNYKFVLKDSNDVLIGTWDNLSGINSNFIAYTNEQEIQTATAGQTVFNLITMQYLPGTNSLSVFVDGVNQYGPGAQYAYEETDQTTVTFVSGLHVGAEVKFTSSQIQNAGVTDASQVGYTYPATDAVPESVQDRLQQYVSVIDFGAVGDGVDDDRLFIQNAVDALPEGGKLVLPAGYTFKIINATGAGATIVDQRADAVSNNTLYAITSSTDNITIQIDGNVVSTSALDDVFRFTGTGVKVCGTGSITGPGVYLDTNSSDPTQQWYPSLVRLEGDYSSCVGLKLEEAPTIGVYLKANRSTAQQNTIVGGPATHGSGTVSFGICLGNTAGGNSYCSALNNRLVPNATGGAMYTMVYSVALSSVISDNVGYGMFEHGVYNYGSYSVIANNRLGGTSATPMLAAGIQSFAQGCTIANNVLSYCTGGISIAACSDTEVIGNNMSVGMLLTGIAVRRYASDATSTTYKNIAISDNVIYVPGITQQAIDVAMDNTVVNLIISNNSITGSAATYGAIVVRNAGSGTLSQVKINNNYIEQCDNYAIELRGITTFNISHNQIVNPNATTNDIAIRATSNCYNGIVKCNQVSDNRVTALTARIFYGAQADGNSNIVVSENSGDTLKSTTNAFVQVPTAGYKYGNTVNGNPTVGTFTVTNATGANVTAPIQTAYGGGTPVLLLPLNQAAWDLQAGANRIHVAGVNVGYFSWSTSSGSATGSTTAQFQYQIMQ